MRPKSQTEIGWGWQVNSYTFLDLRVHLPHLVLRFLDQTLVFLTGMQRDRICTILLQQYHVPTLCPFPAELHQRMQCFIWSRSSTTLDPYVLRWSFYIQAMRAFSHTRYVITYVYVNYRCRTWNHPPAVCQQHYILQWARRSLQQWRVRPGLEKSNLFPLVGITCYIMHTDLTSATTATRPDVYVYDLNGLSAQSSSSNNITYLKFPRIQVNLLSSIRAMYTVNGVFP